MREFINGDCLEGMRQYPDKYFDLAIVDPPYGINIGTASMGAGGCRSSSEQISEGGYKSEEQNPSARIQVGGGLMCHPKIYKAFDDSHPPNAEYFRELERVAKHRIIWGGNYFLDFLGATPCVIVWDKGRRGINFADCEIAWTDIKEPSRIFEFLWNGMLQGDMKNKEDRIHPTQKPIALYKWILTNYAKPGDIILDTHVGSASSLIACEELGFEYVGFEIDEDYYNMARQRIDEFNQQIRMF